MNSSRLPGKALMKLEGKEILLWVVERLKKNNYKIPLAIITSNEESDNPIENFCKQNNLEIFRGSLNNVLERYCKAFDFFGEEFAFRICGDSPLIDPKLIEKAYELSILNKVDLITNLNPRSFPNGQSIEIISKKGLNKLKDYNLNEEQIEHVTLGFYKYAEDFKIINFLSNRNISNYKKHTVDTYEDFLTIQNLISNNDNVIDLDWYQISNILNFS